MSVFLRNETIASFLGIHKFGVRRVPAPDTVVQSNFQLIVTVFADLFAVVVKLLELDLDVDDSGTGTL